MGQVLLTVDDVTRRAHYRNAYRTLRKLLDVRAVPIVNENDTVATEEIRFGDNDRLAALVAALVHADLLVLLSDVDALWTGDPTRPGAARISEVRGEEDLAHVAIGGSGRSGVGTGGMVTKVEAARIATGFGIPVVLTAAPLAAPALAGEAVGTFFHARRQRPRRGCSGSRTPPRRGPAAPRRGRRRRRGRAAQVAAAGGDHRRRRCVHGRRPRGPRGHAGRAGGPRLVNYDAVELPGLLGRSTSELAAALGPAYEREVVHRDDLVLL